MMIDRDEHDERLAEEQAWLDRMASRRPFLCLNSMARSKPEPKAVVPNRADRRAKRGR